MLTLAQHAASEPSLPYGLPAWCWVVYIGFVLVMLILDLTVFHRSAHQVRMKEALGFSAFWIALAMAFMIPLYFAYEHYYVGLGMRSIDPSITNGKTAVINYLTGYIVEESLSVDNLFVFLLIFSFFRVEAQYQHRVLFWGIIGAQVMRFIFIFAGVALISRFHWILFIFGAFLLVTGIKMAIKSGEEVHLERNWVLRLCRRFLRITPAYVDGRFFTHVDTRLYATPLFVVLLVVESTDVAFATDSIPAILGITRDPFIVFSSNVFAIMGLRAMYFALAGLMEVFHLLHYGLAAILVFIGGKMLLETAHHYPDLGLPSMDVPTPIALGVIAACLAVSIGGSLVFPKKHVDQPKADTKLH